MNITAIIMMVLLGVLYSLLLGCSSHSSMNTPFTVGYFGPVCSTDYECEVLHYEGSTLMYDGHGHEVHIPEQHALKELCESDPEDLLDLQECL